jgi:hypothetical protein
MPSQPTPEDHYSANSQPSEGEDEKSRKPQSDTGGIEDLSSDLTMDDLEGSETEQDLIEALGTLDEGDERARAAEEARRERLRPVMEKAAAWHAARSKRTIVKAEAPDETAPAPAPAPKPIPDDPVPPPAHAYPDSGLSFESYLRMVALSAAEEPDWMTRCVGGVAIPACETPVEALDTALPAPAPAPDHERLKANLALLRNARAKAEAKAREKAERNYERFVTAKKERQRELTAARVRRHRAAKDAVAEKTAEEILKELEATPSSDPMPGRVSRQHHKRLVALQAATANPKGDKFLIRIRGREAELAEAWVLEQDAQQKLGKNASQAAVARLHPDKSMTKRQVQSLREIIAKLEAIGGPWNGL